MLKIFGALTCITLSIGMQSRVIAQNSVGELPLCPGVRLDQDLWQTVSYGRLVFKLPPEFRPTEPAVLFAHGGQQWNAGNARVAVVIGWFGRAPFMTPPAVYEPSVLSRCRIEAAGASLLLAETSWQGGQIHLSLPGWVLPDLPIEPDRGGSTTQPMLTATSSNPADLPLLRAIMQTVSQF